VTKANWMVTGLCLLGFGCAHGGDLAVESYPDDQAQVRKRLDEIWNSMAERDVPRLRSYHLYGPKFTEFKDGEPRGDATSGAAKEKEFTLALVDPHVNMKDLAVNVYGDTAVATFNGDFRGQMGGAPIGMQAQSTMVFVKYHGDWKVVHEHFSPLGAPPAPPPGK